MGDDDIGDRSPRHVDLGHGDSHAGHAEFETVEGEFSIAEHDRFLAEHAGSIDVFRARQATAFEAEKERWRAAGEFERSDEPAVAAAVDVEVPEGSVAVAAPFTATVWQVAIAPGDRVAAGDPILSVEAMKMESTVPAPVAGTVLEVYVRPGEQVAPGQVLAAVAP